MSETLPDNSETQASPDVAQTIGTVTVFEALAEPVVYVPATRSGNSSPHSSGSDNTDE